MPNESSFDEAAAHRHFAASCFNEAWAYIEREELSEEEMEAMIDLAHASRHHWRHREDLTPLSRSVSEWQISRVYAVARKPAAARRYGERCLRVSEEHDLPAFYRAYAHEALARAAALQGDEEALRDEVAKALDLAGQVEDEEGRKALERDLATIPTP
jgi:hypothetical protein